MILIHSMSKSHSIAGMRIGYAVGSESNIKRMKPRQANITGGIPYSAEQVLLTITQMKTPRLSAGASSVIGDDARALITWEDECRAFYQHNTCYMQRELEKLGLPTIVPERGIFVFPSIAPLIGRPIPGRAGMLFENDIDVANYFLETKAAVVVPGSAFNIISGHYLRISCSTSMDVLETAIANLRHHISLILESAPSSALSIAPKRLDTSPITALMAHSVLAPIASTGVGEAIAGAGVVPALAGAGTGAIRNTMV